MRIARVLKANPAERRLLRIRYVSDTHPFWSHVDVGSDTVCWRWTGKLDRHGYGYQGRERAHRIAWELFTTTSLQPGDVVRHTCDNPACCNPLHLELGTQQDNVADRVERGRSARGSVNGRARLTKEHALSIFHAPGAYKQIAATYGVSMHTVIDIKNGRTWGWLTGHEYSHRGNLGAVSASSRGAKSDA